MTSSQPSTAPTTRGRSTLVYAAAALVVLLVGATAGMLITLAATGGGEDTPGADSIDVGFAQDMRVHHLQAITLAGMARDRSDDTEVRQLAFDIESTQLDQSGQLSGWLTAWGQPTLPPTDQPHMRWMAGATHSHSSPSGLDLMPGMATSEELMKLRALKDPEFTVYFLQLMLRHHEGGLEMASYAADHARVPYVRNLASKIQQGQSAEVKLLTSMLTSRGAQPLPG
ncbi:DUF305 domain-containing protein [Actinokineospora globicatena]|uniref:DUF305 domain-containing protein n=1 Tax=Actinokineospora globicatena TaxID=103729 RepID=UPI0020A2AC6F|nr:DUF305 domain-containing protein [Actinokineospora globicatena]MCP2302419.1 Uncharacterized conserved protein, DUF305 family [Actinokineospora globicatena]GLW75901.1 DUF305 domain-containing protein [Actinokineospora globicatena]GLW82739.1 DUF305 domain-containing protein [Actinokineospora globicatena]